jgi:hypothetical protein
LEDVLDEKISPAYAEREYGVVVTVATGSVDMERTVALRQAQGDRLITVRAESFDKPGTGSSGA